jgi:4-amino-4-deoxy-L-arabinose transferase-like glycosyltransferase
MKKYIFLLLFLIILIGVFFRIYRLGEQSLWLDEARSFQRANQGIHALWVNQPKESNPPLYDILFHFYLRISGKNNEFALRFLSALIGILLIPLIFFTGKHIFGVKAGLISALIVAISPQHIYYSQDAKMYALLALLSLASFSSYYLALEKNGYLHWASYIITTIALIYTHNMGIFLFLAQVFIFATLFKKVHTRRWNFLISCLSIAIFLLPRIFSWFALISIDANPWIQPVSFKDIIYTPYYFSVLSWGMQITYLVSIALVIALPIYSFVFLRGIFTRNKNDNGKETLFTEFDKLKFVLIYLLVPFILALLVSLKRPIYVVGRYDMFIFPAFCLISGMGLAKIKQANLRVILLAGIVIASVLSLHDYYYVFRKSNDRKVANYLQSHINRDDILIFTDLSAYSFNYYWRQDYQPAMISFPMVDDGWLPRQALECNDAYVNNEIRKTVGRIKEMQKDNSLIWLMFNDIPINRRLVAELKRDYILKGTVDFIPGRNKNQISEVLIFKSRTQSLPDWLPEKLLTR